MLAPLQGDYLALNIVVARLGADGHDVENGFRVAVRCSGILHRIWKVKKEAGRLAHGEIAFRNDVFRRYHLNL